jgi:peptidyl-prolyl cis-trans isomerase D
MLEAMRENSKGLLTTVLFGIIAAVFIISFGPQSMSGCAPSGASSVYAAKVRSNTISDNDFRYAFILAGGARIPPAEAKRAGIKEAVMDYLVQRSLSAQGASDMGFVVSDEEVNQMIADGKGIFPVLRQGGLGKVAVIPARQSLKQVVFKDGGFDYERFRRFVQYELGMTPKRFQEQQRQEILAQRMRDALRVGVKVAATEARDDFNRKSTKVNLSYVAVTPRVIEQSLSFSPEEIADYAKKNEPALKKRYDRKKFFYEKMPKQAKLRHILVRVAMNDTDENKEKAKAKAEAIHARLAKGEDFAKVAAAESEDPATKKKGGDLGFRTYDAFGQGPGFTDALKKLVEQPLNTLSDVVKSDKGFHILRVENKREGKVEMKDVEMELAEDALREDRAQAQAKKLTDEALERLKKGDDPKAVADALNAQVKGAAEPKGDAASSDDEDPAAAGGLAKAGETGLFARSPWSLVEGIGYSPELLEEAFKLNKDRQMPDKPFSVGGKQYVVKLKERKDPDDVEFAKKKDELLAELEQAKWDQVVQAWAVTQKDRYQNTIRINPRVVAYETDAAKGGQQPAPRPISPRRRR